MMKQISDQGESKVKLTQVKELLNAMIDQTPVADDSSSEEDKPQNSKTFNLKKDGQMNNFLR